MWKLQDQATSGFSDPNWNYTVNKNTPQNPLAALEQKDDRSNSNDFVGNIEVDYKFHFLPDLRLHASIGGEYAKVFRPPSILHTHLLTTIMVTPNAMYNISTTCHTIFMPSTLKILTTT